MARPSSALAKPTFDVKALCEQIISFGQALTGFKLFDYQLGFANAIIRDVLYGYGNEIIGKMSRQTGKTTTCRVVVPALQVVLPKLANEVFPEDTLLSRFKQGVWVGIFAPRYEQAFTLYRGILGSLSSKQTKDILCDPDLDLHVKTEKNLTTLTNGSLLAAQSVGPNTHVESKTYHLVIGDESQDMDRTKVRKSIGPMLAFNNGTFVKIGVGCVEKNDFFEAGRRSKRTGDGSTYFLFTEEACMAVNEYYKQFILKERARIGIDSDEYRINYRCEDIIERGQAFTEAMLDAIGEDYNLELSNMDETCFAGIDFGKSKYSTVMTVLAGNPTDADEEGFYLKRVVAWYEWLGDDHESQFHEILEVLKRYNVVTLFGDSTGHGNPIVTRLEHHFWGQINVVGYDFSRPSKSNLWKNLVREVAQRTLTIPSKKFARRQKDMLRGYARFRDQMEGLTKRWENSILICEKDPDEAEARDDYCDSLALALLAAKDGIMPEMEAEPNVFYSKAGMRYAHAHSSLAS